jgi:UDP-glucose 4-epimerase
MNVVVTGASGNVGTAVVDALVRSRGVDRIVGLVRRRPEPVAGGPVDWVSADIAADDLVPLMRGADAVVHLAWQFQPTRDRRETWRTNVIGSQRVFDAARAAGVHAIVHASSVGAYSPFPDDDPDRPVDETWPTHAVPDAAYGTQKSYVERMLDAFELAEPTIRIVRIRSAFVFQRSAAPEQRRIFAGPFLPGRFVASGRLPVLPLPRGLRFQTVHASDLAAAYAAAVREQVAGAFNIAADPIVRSADLGRMLGARVVELPRGLTGAGLAAAFTMRVAPAEPGLLGLFLSLPVMDTSRARTELGWSPAHSSLDALDSFFAGLRSPSGGATPPLDPDTSGPARVREVTAGVGGDEVR